MQPRLLMKSAAFILFGFLITSAAQATLIDRGNGLVYDDVNNISWIKDADVSGLVTWSDQVAWADGFSLAGFDDFRAPTIAELASLYVQLSPPVLGVPKTGDNSPFEDIQFSYWSSSEFDLNNGWAYNFNAGFQFPLNKGNGDYIWAVRDGDSVTAVPEPASLSLLACGALALFLRRRC